MSNILKLHEAISVVLLSCKNRTATVEFIAEEINKRKLYTRKDKKSVPPYQTMLRSKLSKGKYAHLFQFSKPKMVTLI